MSRNIYNGIWLICVTQIELLKFTGNKQEVWSGGPLAIEYPPAAREDGGLIPPLPFRNWGNFIHPTLLSFGRDSKTFWSLLSGVYAKGSKRNM